MKVFLKFFKQSRHKWPNLHSLFTVKLGFFEVFVQKTVKPPGYNARGAFSRSRRRELTQDECWDERLRFCQVAFGVVVNDNDLVRSLTATIRIRTLRHKKFKLDIRLFLNFGIFLGKNLNWKRCVWRIFSISLQINNFEYFYWKF